MGVKYVPVAAAEDGSARSIAMWYAWFMELSAQDQEDKVLGRRCLQMAVVVVACVVITLQIVVFPWWQWILGAMANLLIAAGFILRFEPVSAHYRRLLKKGRVLEVPDFVYDIWRKETSADLPENAVRRYQQLREFLMAQQLLLEALEPDRMVPHPDYVRTIQAIEEQARKLINEMRANGLAHLQELRKLHGLDGPG